MAYGKITKKQEEILEYIKDQIMNRGFPPAVREICEAVNLKSTSSVHAHLETLEKNGYIRRDPTKPRAIEILDDNFNMVRRELVNVPVVGRVAAGEPILATENVESYFPVPAEYVPKNPTFMLTVKGDSMINAGIFSGDHLLIEQKSTAKTVRSLSLFWMIPLPSRLFIRKMVITACNRRMMRWNPSSTDDVQILGKVIGVFRFLH